MDELRDVKLRLPVHHLVRLQGIHLLTRKTMSEVLADALTYYFATSAKPALDHLDEETARAAQPRP